ncbi:hypothetical protein KEM52_004678, partial [Ascosphaera acerosa]
LLTDSTEPGHDLLTTQTTAANSVTPPPIPPNPQKDALRRTQSETLTRQVHADLAQDQSRLQLLASQAEAMQQAAARLLDEISRTTSLRAGLASNVQILQEALGKADEVIASTTGTRTTRTGSHRDGSGGSGDGSGGSDGADGSACAPRPLPLPSIDETLVPPTVVHKQLHDLVVQERAIQRAILALQDALTKGRIGVDVWAKTTRSLAREAFLKRALALKAARGAGLDPADQPTPTPHPHPHPHHQPRPPAMAGPTSSPTHPIKAPGPGIYRFVGTALGASMWFWLFYRAKKEGAVLLGQKHPWDH